MKKRVATEKKNQKKTRRKPEENKVELKNIYHHQSNSTEKILIENFVSLQKVMTNLSIKFDNLSNQITKLLELFEISAKTLVEKNFDFGGSNEQNKEIIKKIDNLAEQNKVIAKGLTLIHEKIPGAESEFAEQPYMKKQMPMQNPQKSSGLKQNVNVNEYHKSLSTKE